MKNKRKAEARKGELLDLLEKTDSLSSGGNELDIEAKKENLPKVVEFIESHLEEANCPMKTVLQISVAVDEVFTNICSYAYNNGIGRAQVRIEKDRDEIRITFTDNGDAFDPLSIDEPDVTLPAAKRQIGGLGIFMVRKMMDKVVYGRLKEKNVLTLTKKLHERTE